MKLTDALLIAKKLLTKNQIGEQEARLLLAYALNIRKEETMLLTEISEEEYQKFMEAINKRCSGMPYAYIVGQKEFMECTFKVNENVLIPREDTECLVEEVINICEKICNEKMISRLTILDMCTGSGCIAISLYKLLKERKIEAKIIAVDKSIDALQVAKENATLNNAEIEFIESDLFSKLESNLTFDIIVSNPPYIKTDVIDTLQKEVKDYEPMMALDGGEDGLNFYKKIIEKSKDYLKEDGYLAFEIGFDEANEINILMQENDFKNVFIKKDLGGNDRVLIGQKNSV